MNELRNFSNPVFGGLSIVDIDGENYFLGKEVATILGYTNPSDAVLQHVDKEDRKSLKFRNYRETAIINLWNDSDYTNKLVINESGLYSLILNSQLPQAKQFKRWVTHEVLPSIRKYGTYSITKTADIVDTETSEMKKHLLFAELTANYLRLDENSKLRTAHLIAERFNVQGYLPEYTTPKDVHFSLTELLKKNNVSISARKFNEKLLQLGYLEAYTRKTKDGKDKTFFSVSEKGAPYGLNQSSPHNPNETQPHWYEHTFSELLTNITNSTNSLF